MDHANVLSLCSGGAGLDLAIELAVGSARTVCYVEREAFAVHYLASAMEAGCLAPAPVWTDLRTFDGRAWRGVVDCLTAGYPCQPFSKAGRRRGKDDPRHLWPHVARVVGEVEPAVCFFENVPDHLSLGFDEVAGDLESLGYEVAAGLFGADEAGASHRRERLFILALADVDRTRLPDPEQRGLPAAAEQGEAGPTTGELRLPLFPPGPDETGAWRRVLDFDDALAPAQPTLRLVADGVADVRADWLRLLGNGVVPLAAAYAFCSLWAALRG